MKQFTNYAPTNLTVTADDLFAIMEEYCACLRSIGYDATAGFYRASASVELQVERDEWPLIEEISPLTPDYVAEFARWAGAAYFQHVLNINARRIAVLGWTVEVDGKIPLVTIERHAEEALRFSPTYAEALNLVSALDYAETAWLMGQATQLFAEVGWKRGVNTDSYVWIKPDGRGFDVVPLNDPEVANQLIQQAQDELAEKHAAKIASDLDLDNPT